MLQLLIFFISLAYTQSDTDSGSPNYTIPAVTALMRLQIATNQGFRDKALVEMVSQRRGQRAPSLGLPAPGGLSGSGDT